jgi:hypothetical protein
MYGASLPAVLEAIMIIVFCQGKNMLDKNRDCAIKTKFLTILKGREGNR